MREMGHFSVASAHLIRLQASNTKENWIPSFTGIAVFKIHNFNSQVFSPFWHPISIRLANTFSENAFGTSEERIAFKELNFERQVVCGQFFNTCIP